MPKPFEDPNFTPVPNELFDQVLPHISGDELKVILAITRKCLKRKKCNQDAGQFYASVSELSNTTGLSEDVVAGCVDSLERNGLIVRRISTNSVYRLRFEGDPKTSRESAVA